MRIIREAKDVIRVEAGSGAYRDFDPNSYSGESDAYWYYEEMGREGRHPRMYRGTITTELEEMK